MVKPIIIGHNCVTDSMSKVAGGTIGLLRGKEIGGRWSKGVTTLTLPKATTTPSVRWGGRGKGTCSGGVSREGICREKGLCLVSKTRLMIQKKTINLRGIERVGTSSN